MKDAGGEFFLEGPHCGHDDCPWTHCYEVDTDNPEVDAVLRFCGEIRRCTICGPTSRAWTKLVGEWIEWVTGWRGTADLARLRELGVPPNVIEVAELIEAHPVRGASC